MIPYPEQEELATDICKLIEKDYIAYVNWEERTGKTLGIIHACEQLDINKVLVFTTKKALDGWNETLQKYKHKKVYRVTNYHQAKHIKGPYDLVVLDEAHNYISSYPKTSAIWQEIRRLTRRKLIIYASATSHAQGHSLLFHQFALSDYSPWNNFSSFYSWFNTYGIPEILFLHGRQIKKYNKTVEETFESIEHLFLTKTRKELNFPHEPEDKLHYITLDKLTEDVYNTLTKDRIIELRGKQLVADTVMKLRTSLHMLEGGVAKIKDEYIVLNNREKIDYILDKWGDDNDVCIMYNYIAEGTKLREIFKYAKILQGTSYAEGVELSSYRHLIIYSQDFRTSKHVQRRARQASKQRTSHIDIHFLLVKSGTSEQVYNTVALNKVNFVDATFNRNLIGEERCL